MPTVLRSGPYRVYFYSNERDEPPHAHVDREGKTAKFWLQPLSLASQDGFRPHELRRIAAILDEHLFTLLEAWHDVFEE